MSRINPKTLGIAAVLLLILALVMLATPLMRFSTLSGGAGAVRQLDGQNLPGGQNFMPGTGEGLPGGGLPNQENFTPPQGNAGGDGFTFSNRQPSGTGFGLLQFGMLNGINGTIVYGAALLISLAAAIGMFLARRWGQVLGICMAVVYLLLTILGFLPLILTGARAVIGGLSMGLGIAKGVLALAVIVLALIPTRKPLVSAPLEATGAPEQAGG